MRCNYQIHIPVRHRPTRKSKPEYLHSLPRPAEKRADRFECTWTKHLEPSMTITNNIVRPANERRRGADPSGIWNHANDPTDHTHTTESETTVVEYGQRSSTVTNDPYKSTKEIKGTTAKSKNSRKKTGRFPDEPARGDSKKSHPQPSDLYSTYERALLDQRQQQQVQQDDRKKSKQKQQPDLYPTYEQSWLDHPQQQSVVDDPSSIQKPALVGQPGTDDGPDFASCHPGEDREYVSIPDDAYNLFFISDVCGPAFFFALYIFALKLALFSLLAIDAIVNGDETSRNGLVVAAQFLLLPVAVGMQDDLTSTFNLIANVKYCPSIMKRHPGATPWKYRTANACRCIDGTFSLLVNFVVMINASSVQGLFLNFAALHFLQSVDNIALDLAAQGFLGDRLEEKAKDVQELHLPKRREGHWKRAMDSVLFLATASSLFGIWVWYIFFMTSDENNM